MTRGHRDNGLYCLRDASGYVETETVWKWEYFRCGVITMYIQNIHEIKAKSVYIHRPNGVVKPREQSLKPYYGNRGANLSFNDNWKPVIPHRLKNGSSWNKKQIFFQENFVFDPPNNLCRKSFYREWHKKWFLEMRLVSYICQKYHF